MVDGERKSKWLSVAFWALIKMGYVSEGRSSFKIGSRASGLVFFPYHSRNGWRKSPAPLVPDRTADGSPTVGRIRILACAGVFFVLESSKLENPSLSERYEPGFWWTKHLRRSYPSHFDQSGLDGDSDLVESLVETRGISRNRSPSERMEREQLATTNRHGNEYPGNIGHSGNNNTIMLVLLKQAK
ncbi:hypothetical protein PRIPAC_82099, partial [Pristionchus pacificus]|uniref:Uncharacterized protein n=1 Tax=Pristionchus pacificus TaxID=54126 RepID=A0A2A6BHS5_PRIPA